MTITSNALALGIILLLISPFARCVDIDPDTPVNKLVASAKANLASGNPNDALTFFDAAIAKDPNNYLTIFQRGAAYLSLGRNGKATDDFNKALSIKPDFEGALVQRAKIYSRSADWAKAKKDYKTAGKTEAPEYKELEEAEQAVALASAAEKAKDWEGCVTHSGTAILVASTALSLRQMRARCRFERGEVQEGVADLQHVLQISPSSVIPHIQISSMLFYSLGDTEKALAQIRKCLQSDPDSKPCKKLHREEKKADKQLKKLEELRGRKQFSSAVKILVGDGEDIGLLSQVKEDVKSGKESEMIHKNSPDGLYARLIDTTCELYGEMNNKKKAALYCEENLKLNPDSLSALLFKARGQIESEDFEPAINTLEHAKEVHGQTQQINTLLQKAHTLLKRSKTKDYYKVMGVANDADDRTIKKAYRTLTKKFHPDKAAGSGLTREQAEKKMVGINEAYEVLSDPEKRAMFDRGDDPNSPEQQGNPFHGSPFGGGQQFFFQRGGGSHQ